MRRRPSAAADDVTNAIPTDENIVPASPVEGAEKPKPTRARRTTKKVVTDETPAPEETPVVEAVVEEKPKPTRTRRTPAKKAESPPTPV